MRPASASAAPPRDTMTPSPLPIYEFRNQTQTRHWPADCSLDHLMPHPCESPAPLVAHPSKSYAT